MAVIVKIKTARKNSEKSGCTGGETVLWKGFTLQLPKQEIRVFERIAGKSCGGFIFWKFISV